MPSRDANMLTCLFVWRAAAEGHGRSVPEDRTRENSSPRRLCSPPPFRHAAHVLGVVQLEDPTLSTSNILTSLNSCRRHRLGWSVAEEATALVPLLSGRYPTYLSCPAPPCNFVVAGWTPTCLCRPLVGERNQSPQERLLTAHHTRVRGRVVDSVAVVRLHPPSPGLSPR